MIGFWILAFLIHTSEFWGEGYKSDVPAIFFFFIGLMSFVYTVHYSNEARKLNKAIDKILKGKEKRFVIVDSVYKKVKEYAENNGLTRELKDLLTKLDKIKKRIQSEFPTE